MVTPPVKPNDVTARISWFVGLASFALIIVMLRYAEDVLVPVAFAVLLAFLLSPLVVRLTRIGLPKALAIILTVSVSFSVIGGIGWLVTTQAISLVRELPNYEENLRQKIAALKRPQSPEVMTRVTGMVENLRREIKSQAPDVQVTPAPPGEEKPVPVAVQEADPTPWELARNLARPILRPLGVAGIVIVFVVAMLFQREDLRDRFLKLVSAGKLNVATQAIDDAATRVSRYLGMQLIVNASYGVPIGLGVWWIGIPNAPLWGLLATLLRFIPFIGPWIAAVFPVMLSIAVDPGWTMLVYTLALFVVMELISNNVIEIILYGASTGISNMALLIAAVFWTWLWGPAGLVLSTPLTVCLLVLGNHVPGMSFLSSLLGSKPALEPPAHFYQRMLSMESEDMLEVASTYIAEHSVEEFYEQIFVPALLMSEEDRHSGSLPEVRQRFIFQAGRELIEELERQDEVARVEEAGGSANLDQTNTQPTPPVVLGLSARDEADELVGLMLCHLLRRRRIPAAVNPLAASLDDALAALAHEQISLAFVSALPPSAVTAARHMCRRVRLQSPESPLIVGIWRHGAPLAEIAQRLSMHKPTAVVDSLHDAVARIEAIVGPRELPVAPTEPAVAAPDPSAASEAGAVTPLIIEPRV